MDSVRQESHSEMLERSKTAEPYSEEEMNVWDERKDPARLFATMRVYGEKLEREHRTR